MKFSLLHNETSAYNDFISHFQLINESGDELQCICPSCGKKKLYISVGENNGVHKMLLNCFHSCDYKDILNAAGLEPKQLYLAQTQRFTKNQCTTKREHVYNDKDGNPKFRKTIYKYHSYWEYNGKQQFPGDKETYWEHYNGTEWISKGSCNILYHLDKLRGDTVYIPEGEKDVETLEKMGFTATTTGGGAKQTASEWTKNKYIEQLTGIKNAVILADNDEIGIKYAAAVAAYLTKGGISCKVIEAPAIYSEVQHKGDISDIVGAVGADKAKELLEKAVEAAEPYLLPAEDPKTETAPERSKSDNPYNADGNGRLSIANLKAALKILDISVKHNKINHKIEYSGAGLKGIDPAGVNTVVPHLIYNKLQFFLKGCNAEKIAAFLNAIAFEDESEYNPVLEAINGTKWDNKDHLNELYTLMNLDPEDKLSQTLLRKWLMQCYCGLYNSLDNPFSLDLVLVLVGKQGYGKTRLFEKLALSRKYFGEGITLDTKDKDSRMQSTAYWIAELGEIGSTMKKEINALKAFISNPTDENRPPYGKSPVTHPRLTSFCGTTNDMQFLIDETGNRRYATIKLPDEKYIDVKSKAFKEFEALQLWAQIADIVNTAIQQENESYSSVFRLSKQEETELAERNKKHSKPLKGEQEVADIIAAAYITDNRYSTLFGWFTPTQFREDHLDSLRNYSAVQIGKCLLKLGYEQKRKKVNGSVCSAYYLPYRKWNGIEYKQVQ